jgi:hypothetical protein
MAAVLGILFGLGWVLGALANETRTVVHRYDDRLVDVVDAASGSGDVVVVGDRRPGSGIVVRVRYTDGLLGNRHHERRVGRRIELRADCPFLWSVRCDVRIEVHGPPGLTVIAATDNGDVRLGHLSGTVRVSTDNGDVTGTDLRTPSLTSETDNGDVTLRFATPPRRVSAASDNGDLQLRLPQGDDVAYALATRTDNGDVDTPIRTDPGSPRTITATSDNGDIAIRYGR